MNIPIFQSFKTDGSAEAQKYITGKLCTWVSKVSPYAYEIGAMQITELRCGASGTFTYNAFFPLRILRQEAISGRVFKPYVRHRTRH
jgi:hypothetical protein